MVLFVRHMVRKLEGKLIQCDECGAHLEYENSDVYEAPNFNHSHRVRYVDCPECGNSIPIERVV